MKPKIVKLSELKEVNYSLKQYLLDIKNIFEYAVILQETLCAAFYYFWDAINFIENQNFKEDYIIVSLYD